MTIKGAYTLTDSRTGKFYVGSSENIRKRFERHYYDLSRQQHHCPGLQDLWNKNGRLTEVVFPTENVEEARQLEQDILDRFKNSDLLLNIGLSAIGGDNLTRHPRRDEIIFQIKESLRERLGGLTNLEKRQLFGRPGSRNGMWGKTHSKEARARISFAQKQIQHSSGYKLNLSDETRKAISERAKKRIGSLNPFHGKQHSEETKKRISEIKKAQNLLPPNTRKVEIDGVVYESLTDAARTKSVVPALILYRIKSDKEKYAGYKYLT